MASDEDPHRPPPIEEVQPAPPPLPTEPPLSSEWSAPPMGGQQAQWPQQPGPGAPRSGSLDRIIPTSNPPALIAYYLGVFSVLCPLAPFALVLGIIGLNRIKKDPTLPGKGHAITGIVLGSIFCLLSLGLVFLFVLNARVVNTIH